MICLCYEKVCSLLEKRKQGNAFFNFHLAGGGYSTASSFHMLDFWAIFILFFIALNNLSSSNLCNDSANFFYNLL